MKRREIITLLGGVVLWPVTARAQAQPAANVAVDNQVGQVATVQGSATVTRANAAAALIKVSDAILKGDEVATGANSSLGITFDDETTFSLSADTRIVINEFVYQEGGKANRGLFNAARGTVAFVAGFLARTGDMKITAETVAIGIRGTTGLVDVPEGGTAGEAKVKLYPDADGRVGRIEVFNPQGARLGALTQGASAFAIRRDARGQVAAVPFRIPPQEAARDRALVQRLFASHNIGRRITLARARARAANPPYGGTTARRSLRILLQRARSRPPNLQGKSPRVRRGERMNMANPAPGAPARA
jgi:FecR protein